MNHQNGKQTNCNPDHTWVFIGSEASGKVPSGQSCLCGQKIALYTICDQCGAERFDPVTVSNKNEEK